MKNIIIFDWDDTLFPTYAYKHWDDDDAQMNDHMGVVYKLLQTALKSGDEVKIITNASLDWVLGCLSMPSLAKVSELINEAKIPIISAREEYLEIHGVNKSYDSWKIHSFGRHVFFDIKKEQAHKSIDAMRQVIGFGDSARDRMALLQYMGKLKHYVSYKSFLLDRNPSIPRLTEQLNIILQQMASIIRYRGHIDDKLADCTVYKETSYLPFRH